jgi:hypothetical protein
MQAVRTQYHRDELAGRLSDLRVAIESAVPLSAGSYNRQISATAADRVETLTKLAEKRRSTRPRTRGPGRCSSVRWTPAITSSR